MHTDRAREFDELADEIDAVASQLDDAAAALSERGGLTHAATPSDCHIAATTAASVAERLRELAMDERTIPATR